MRSNGFQEKIDFTRDMNWGILMLYEKSTFRLYRGYGHVYEIRVASRA